MIIQYEVYNWKDNNLWEQFREDFKEFTEEDFKKCSIPIKRKLRSFLRTRGVKVDPNDSYRSFTKCLTTVLTEEEPAIWSIKDIEDYLVSGEEFNSSKINYLLKKYSSTPFEGPITRPQTPTG